MNTFSILIATAEAGVVDTPEVQVLPLVMLGFLFVIFVLSLLSGITGVMGFLFARRAAVVAGEIAARLETVAANPKVAAPSENQAIAENDPVIHAVIAAAIHSVIDNGRGRIVSVRPSSGGGWAQEGRRQIFSSRLGRN